MVVPELVEFFQSSLVQVCSFTKSSLRFFALYMATMKLQFLLESSYNTSILHEQVSLDEFATTV